MNLTLENYNKFVDSNNRPKQSNYKPKQNKLTNKNGSNQQKLGMATITRLTG